MKVEIWSDVACPFCYIGKRHFEAALEQFADRDALDITWKSFQLDPTTPEVASESHAEYLMKRKGFAAEQVEQMMLQVTEMASHAGLDFHLDKSIIVNTRKAHLFIQFAKTKKLGDQAEERLFRAYFTEGLNIADEATLLQLGQEIGLSKSEVQASFTSEKYAYEMAQDIQESRSLGISGVPFFVFDRKYGVSGAQPVQVFLDSLNKAFGEWKSVQASVKLDVIGGNSCSVDGTCD